MHKRIHVSVSEVMDQTTRVSLKSLEDDLDQLIKGINDHVEISSAARVFARTDVPAGGTGALLVGSADFGLYFGSGPPTISAGTNSLYLRSDGTGTNGRIYVNVDGGTGWTYVVTGT